ncbi:MAG: methylmalonyl Co-A mutase-associated GTPase MeaB [Holophaga sp.]|nr:methylmalonyl Co-A mutase-associated GTPase MeaB [Holophaga sp.]
MERAQDLFQPLLDGHPRALARAISWMENGHPEARNLMALLWPHMGRAVVVGLTGAPGAGKSTLTDQLARSLRAEGQKVGILAVDPTSPFSGGAILGDRIRMNHIADDPGIFIRSMATRGALGGLARATQDAIDLLDAAGYDVVLVETVGVGQDEVDVVSCVQTCIVVLIPGMGDDIQAIKAGIMEVADIFVINKADRDGVEKVEREIEGMKSLSTLRPWDPPVLRTVAAHGQGIQEVLGQIREHGGWLREHGGLAAKAMERAKLRFASLLAEEASRRARARAGSGRVDELIHAIADRHLDPYAAVAAVLDANESSSASGR